MKKIYSEDLIKFIEKSPCAFHATDEIKKRLISEGFMQLIPSNKWDIIKGGKYFTTKNDSSLIAFSIGSEINDYSFNIVASHTDSPSFKIKPNSTISLDNKYTKLNTEPYGGSLFATWFDRPLSVAGRVLVSEGDKITTHLVNVDKDLLMIPSLAIHMNREANSGYKYNAQVDLLPLMGGKSDDKEPLLKIVAKTLKIKETDILSHDLFLYPRNQGFIWGINNEYLSIARLDDLECVYTSLIAFINSKNKESINIYCAFDNEEVGSRTKQGAASTFLFDTLKRINNKLGFSDEALDCALASSSIVSADNAHALHPNHPEKSDAQNRVYMNEGIVIKHNANQSYTSDATSSAVFKSICDEAKIPVQYFTNRSDMVGGGTLGSISSSQVSISSVDIGLAQLAMHSAFETCGVKDLEYMIKGLTSYYSTHIKKINDNIVYKHHE